MTYSVRIGLLGFVVGALVTIPVIADAKDKGSKHSKHGKYEKSDDVDLHISINHSDQYVIREFLRDRYMPNCPPGLAKKHNGCLPPGIAKKYRVGGKLPSGVRYESLPASIVSQLHPPRGYRYVQVDRDVLLIGEATKHIIDAVTLLSAVQ